MCGVIATLCTQAQHAINIHSLYTGIEVVIDWSVRLEVEGHTACSTTGLCRKDDLRQLVAVKTVVRLIRGLQLVDELWYARFVYKGHCAAAPPSTYDDPASAP